jgi:hypothetical protein
MVELLAAGFDDLSDNFSNSSPEAVKASRKSPTSA